MTEQALEITGLKDVQKALYGFSQQLGDRVVRGALRQGANYVLKGIKELIPVGQTRKVKGVSVVGGLLKRRGFRVANSKIHAGKMSNDMIGIYISLRKKKGDPFYGRFLNDGWNPAGRKATAEDRPGMAMVFGSGSRMAKRWSAPAHGRGGALYSKVPGQQFVQRGFESRKDAAVDLIVRAAEAGAEVVKRKVGLR